MKKLYFVTAMASLAFAANALNPEMAAYSDYTGTSFQANWNNPSTVNLYVFSENEKDVKSLTQDFSGVIENAKINYSKVADLAPVWGLNVSDSGTTDVVYVNGKDRVLLDGNEDYVMMFSPDGFIKSLKLSAWLVDAEGISEANSSRLRVEILGNDGTRYRYGQTYVMLYGKVTEYDFADAFSNLENVCGVKFVIEKDDVNKVGSLAINNISYSFASRNMIVDGVEASGGKYTVENCDPTEIYYYYGVDPGTGDRSFIETVDGFVAPELLEATGIDHTCYTANWGTPYKATSLTLRNYRLWEFEDPGEYFVLNEDFDAANEGTVSKPVKVNSLDPYTLKPDWEVADGAALIADGMIGTAKSVGTWPPKGGYIYSPLVNLGADDGWYTISTKIYGTPDDVITIYRYNSMTGNYQLYSHTLTIGADGIAEETWQMDDGIDNTMLCLESKDTKQFFLDYFKVSVKMPAGSSASDLMSSVKIEDINTRSYKFDNLEYDGLYGYQIIAHGLEFGMYDRDSYPSPIKKVQLAAAAGLESVAGAEDAIEVKAVTGGVSIFSEKACDVQVYNTAGVQMAALHLADNATFVVPATPGNLLIVKVGSKVVKVLTR